VDFFQVKFPELKGKEFYVTGESYAGVYIPTLAKELLDNAKGKVNFKGLAVGDPCTDVVAQQDSMDGLWYGHKMGFVQDQAFDFLWHTCKARSPSLQAQGASKSLFVAREKKLIQQVHAESNGKVLLKRGS